MFRVFLPSLALILLLPSASFAGGMAVADAVSHMYESLNLEKTIQQLETGLQQLELVQQYTDRIQESYDMATANYSKAKGVYDDLLAVKDFYDKTVSTWQGRYEQYKNFYDAVTDPDKAIEEFKDLLDDAFVDPRNLDPEEWEKIMDRQFDLRQLALKDLMESNDETMKSMEDRVTKAQDLAQEIDKTGNPKEAADLSNRLLLEILLVLQDMLAQDARYQQTMASLDYRGVTEKSIEARQNKLKDIQNKRSQKRWETLELEKYNLSKDSTISEIRANEKKPTLDELIKWGE